MTEKTMRTLQIIAAREGVSPEYIENEIRKAIQEAMTSTDPHAQALWKQIAPNGKEPDLDTFFEFVTTKVQDAINQRKP